MSILVGDGFGLFLAKLASLFRFQRRCFTLSVVKYADVVEGLLSDRALVCYMQIMEPTPGVGLADDLGNAFGVTLFITAVTTYRA